MNVLQYVKLCCFVLYLYRCSYVLLDSKLFTVVLNHPNLCNYVRLCELDIYIYMYIVHDMF